MHLFSHARMLERARSCSKTAKAARAAACPSRTEASDTGKSLSGQRERELAEERRHAQRNTSKRPLASIFSYCLKTHTRPAWKFDPASCGSHAGTPSPRPRGEWRERAQETRARVKVNEPRSLIDGTATRGSVGMLAQHSSKVCDRPVVRCSNFASHRLDARSSNFVSHAFSDSSTCRDLYGPRRARAPDEESSGVLAHQPRRRRCAPAGRFAVAADPHTPFLHIALLDACVELSRA